MAGVVLFITSPFANAGTDRTTGSQHGVNVASPLLVGRLQVGLGPPQRSRHILRSPDARLRW